MFLLGEFNPNTGRDDMTVEGTDKEQYNHNPNEGNNPDEHKDCLNLSYSRSQKRYILL